MSNVTDLLGDLADRASLAADLLRDCPGFGDPENYQLRAALQLVCQVGFMADTAAQARGTFPRLGGAAEWFGSEALRSPRRGSRQGLEDNAA